MFIRMVHTVVFILSVSFLCAAEAEHNIPVEHIRGNKSKNPPGIYDSPTESANIPGGRTGFSSWSDSAGNMWIFGGNGYDEAGGYGPLGDLWKYNPSTNIWTWVSGSKLVRSEGDYDSPSPHPGSRQYAASWVDNEGHLWLFGGRPWSGYLNDFWKYDIAEGKWSFEGGSKFTNAYPIYEGEDAFPGCRSEAMSWKDSHGDFWLFGGWGWSDEVYNNSGALNDLWKYSHSTGKWTWEGGSKDTDSPGNYAGENLMPRARTSGAVWVDNEGHLWLFGGESWDDDWFFLNDFWKFDVEAKIWSFMGGRASGSRLGKYTGENPYPGGRMFAVSWTDLAGDLWLGRGYGIDYSDGDYYDEIFDDLWKYNIETNKWKWMRGHDYGSPEVSANEIPAGDSGAAWVDNLGDVWLFGGTRSIGNDTGRVNDMWKFWFSDSNGPVTSGSMTLTGSASPTSVALGEPATVKFDVKNEGSEPSEGSTFTFTIPQDFMVKGTPTIVPAGAGTVSASSGSIAVSLTPIPADGTVSISVPVTPLVVGSGNVGGTLVWGTNSITSNVGLTGTSTGSDDLSGEGSVSKVKVKTSKKKGTTTQASVAITMKNSIAGSVPVTVADVYVSDSSNVSSIQGSQPVTSVKMGKLKNKEGKPLKATSKKAKLKLSGDMQGKYVFIHLDKDNVVPETNEYNNYISAGQIR